MITSLITHTLAVEIMLIITIVPYHFSHPLSFFVVSLFSMQEKLPLYLSFFHFDVVGIGTPERRKRVFVTIEPFLIHAPSKIQRTPDAVIFNPDESRTMHMSLVVGWVQEEARTILQCCCQPSRISIHASIIFPTLVILECMKCEFHRRTDRECHDISSV